MERWVASRSVVILRVSTALLLFALSTVTAGVLLRTSLVVVGVPPLVAVCAEGGLIVVWFADVEVEGVGLFFSVISGFRYFLSFKATDN